MYDRADNRTVALDRQRLIQSIAARMARTMIIAPRSAVGGSGSLFQHAGRQPLRKLPT